MMKVIGGGGLGKETGEPPVIGRVSQQGRPITATLIRLVRAASDLSWPSPTLRTHTGGNPENEERPMDFTISATQKQWLDRVQSFMNKHVRPAVPIYDKQDEEGPRWKVSPIIEELKKKARAEGLWNMFMPPSSHEDDEFQGAGLSNLEYALLSEEMGRISWASEVFNCSAPDTGNMEVLIRYGNKEQKRQWLRRLMDGEIRSAFLMTEPAVASSDATNIETRVARHGNHYVINGRKWRSAGRGDPRRKIPILMVHTYPK